jgi:DNA polymerase III subunit delta'
MTDESSTRSLFGDLCPWLHASFEQLDSARAGSRLGHSWLVAGPAGVGKINLALVLAHRLLEPSRPKPSVLDARVAAAAMRQRHAPTDHHPDLHWLFPEEDKRTISIEQIRAAGEALGLKSHKGHAKAVVIEPADAMTESAANALLKTLEEPTPDTYLFLVSHRPERLPPTIRSRCQTLPVRKPPTRDALAWLRSAADAEAVERLLLLAGGAPFRALNLIESDFLSLDKSLEGKLIAISKDRVDPQTVAEEWLKLDLEAILPWLARRLQLAIRGRLAPEASNRVTSADFDELHNAWGAMTLPALFGRLEATEKLLDQLGAGTNVELALRVLLLGFSPRLSI